jgi:hypothetical protein
LPSRDTPDYVDWAPTSIPLEDECTRSFGVSGIVLDNDGSADTVKYLTRQDTVLSHLVVSVRGDPNLSAADEVGDPAKGIAHLVIASVSDCVICSFKGELLFDCNTVIFYGMLASNSGCEHLYCARSCFVPLWPGLRCSRTREPEDSRGGPSGLGSWTADGDPHRLPSGSAVYKSGSSLRTLVMLTRWQRTG